MNIARESIKRSKVVLFVCAMLAFAGLSAYFQIGKLEDPSFTIKTAVITISYPGATAYEVEDEAVSRVEDAIQEMGQIKHIRSHCFPEMALVYVDIKDKYMAGELPEIWDILRQKMYDVQTSMPAGSAIMINNDFGEVYGQFYALVGDGYSMKEIWDYADFLKKQIVLVPGVASVKIIGEQQECIYVEFSASRMANLGISPTSVFDVLNQQNTLSTIGSTTLGDRYVRVSPTSAITSVDDIANLVIGGSGGRLIRLREVATVRRDFMDPQSFMMRFNERPSLGLGIATVEGGNVVTMREAVAKCLTELEVYRPIGMELNEIYMQSDQVTHSVNDFIVNLIESLIIVVGVLLVFMGLQAGIIIGIILLLTIAGTFTVMNYSGIFLQTVSLAALIIALGSLVDNAIVVSEGMLIGVQRGMPALHAAEEAVEESKWAMLGGTVIAILAFCPIGLSQDSTGEYCRSLLQVVAISMLFSWVLALTATPVLGKMMFKRGKGAMDPYNKPIFRLYRKFLEGCLHHRFLTISATVLMFLLSLWGFSALGTSFFPDSSSVYFTVDLWGEEGVTLASQRRMTMKLEQYLRSRPQVKNISSFIGSGSLRFMLTYSPPDPDNAYSQLLVECYEPEQTRPVLLDVQKYMDEQMPEIEGECKAFSRGSGSTPKLEARFYGEDPATLRALAEQALAIVKAEPRHNFARIDWRDPVEVLHPQVLKDQMQNLGLTRPMINQSILMATTGLTVGAYRDGDRSLPILAALVPEERNRMDKLKSFPIWTPTGNKSTPLSTVISTVDTAFEDNIIMRRDRSRVITVASGVKVGENADEMFNNVKGAIEAIKLPVGYSLEWGGEKESSDNATGGMSTMFLPVLLLMFTIMVFLFNGFKQPIIIFMALPMIVIGMVIGLAVARMDVSFLALIGLLSLVGMLAKNSIVLLDQVSADFASGRDKYESIVDDAVSRLRPVSMSALTTVLGMVPLIWDLMFGPMAVTIMAGLTVSTILTMIVIPVMTAIVFRVPNPERR